MIMGCGREPVLSGAEGTRGRSLGGIQHGPRLSVRVNVKAQITSRQVNGDVRTALGF